MTEDERDRRFRAERRERSRAGPRIQRETAATIVALLARARDEVQARLAGLPTDWETWYLPQLRREVELALGRFQAEGGNAIGAAAGASWQAGVALVDAPVAAGGVNLPGLLPSIDDAQLRAMRSFMTDRIKDIGRQAVDRINGELGLAAIGAQGIDRAAGRVAEVLQSGRCRALTIVRTELGRAFSTAANERIGQAATILPGMGKQWRRSGKLHSRPGHDLADGQMRQADEPFLVDGERLRYPRDPKASPRNTVNCGCTLLPHMAHWEMGQPGAVPFSNAEIAVQPRRRELPPGQESEADRLRRLRLAPPADARREVAGFVAGPAFGRFLARPQGDPMPVAVLPRPLQDGLGALDRVVRLSTPTAAKIAARHPEVGPGVVGALQGALADAAAVRLQDPANALALFRHDGAWWRGVVKRTADRRELYVTTLHRTSEHKARRDLARWPGIAG